MAIYESLQYHAHFRDKNIQVCTPKYEKSNFVHTDRGNYKNKYFLEME